jgi:hypothetical protein
MATIDVLERIEAQGKIADSQKPFGPYQEEATISLALDHPEFFTSAARFMKPEMFGKLEARWIIAEILNSFEKHGVIPTRKWLRSHLEQQVTEDDPYEEIFRLVERKSDPREVPLVKDTLLKWSRDRAYGLLYSDEAVEAFHRGDFAYLENIINEANRIADVGSAGFWFFENMEQLFQPDVIQHRTTGFPRLDRLLNNGGPGAKEVCCWLAGTNVGKCHSDQTLIIEERLSRIYELELEDGKIIKLRGSREVQTLRGTVKVCDLTASDELTEIPSGNDTWDLELPTM